jgi:hypothetical protein
VYAHEIGAEPSQLGTALDQINAEMEAIVDTTYRSMGVDPAVLQRRRPRPRPWSQDHPDAPPPRVVGADASTQSSKFPLVLGAIGLTVVGLAVLGAATRAKQQPRLTAHEKEVRAWEAEFPGLPWYADQVKDARQLDLWERARDYWERKR